MTDQLPILHQVVHEWSGDLGRFRQNHLLDEARFIEFARGLGIDVQGVVRGDPGVMHSRGWLTSDGQDGSGEPVFHPFRIYPLHMSLRACRANSEDRTSLDEDRVSWMTEQRLVSTPASSLTGDAAVQRNRVVDLAVLLEPVYWPDITGHLVRITDPFDAMPSSGDDYQVQLGQYHEKVLGFIRTLDADLWQRAHTSLRTDAAWLDRNDDLYLLLRLSNWDRRKKLTGRIAGITLA